MPIILKNSHSHSFGWTDAETGEERTVKVLRGQDIEHLNLPQKRLAKLLSEYVVSFDGKHRFPRYEYSEEVTDEDGSTYTSGVVTSQLAQRALRTSDEKAKALSKEELRKLQADAEAAEMADNQADLREEAEMAAAAAEQAEKDRAAEKARADAAEAKLAQLEASQAAQGDAAKEPAKRGPGRPAKAK